MTNYGTTNLALDALLSSLFHNSQFIVIAPNKHHIWFFKDISITDDMHYSLKVTSNDTWVDNFCVLISSKWSNNNHTVVELSSCKLCPQTLLMLWCHPHLAQYCNDIAKLCMLKQRACPRNTNIIKIDTHHIPCFIPDDLPKRLWNCIKMEPLEHAKHHGDILLVLWIALLLLSHIKRVCNLCETISKWIWRP